MEMIQIALVGSFLIALGVTAALIPLTIVLGEKLGFIDEPSARKVHSAPIPRTGGIGILAGLVCGGITAAGCAYLAGVNIDFPMQRKLVALLAACVFVAAVGFVDDIRNVSSRFKLLVLLCSGAALCGAGATFGGMKLGGDEPIQLQWLDWAATVLWLAAIPVAVNFIDGLDGLAAGLVGLSAAVLSAFLIGWQNVVLAGISLALVGSLCGFLIYNRHPAKVFMGDCGSMLIGVCIASLMIVSNVEIGSMRAVLLPSLALAIPLADGSLTFFRRHYLQRRSIFSAERGHIHHRLLDRGLRHNQAVWFLYLVSFAAVLIGLISLLFEGWATLAGLCLLIPLLWGTFQFAGSVRTNEMLRALRNKRELDRHSKRNRNLFESLQLEFEHIHSFGSWWHGICKAAEQLEFVQLKLEIESPAKTRKLVWTHPSEEMLTVPTIHASIPIRDSNYHGGTARAEIEIAVTQSVELASDRLALFSRLTTEHCLEEVRRRERLALRRHGSNGRPKPEELLTHQDQPAEQGEFGHLRVALVHDFLYTYCGAERVVEQLINVFPHCDVFALFDFLPDGERGFLRGKHVTTSFIQRMPMAARKHRAYLPFMPFAIEQLDVSDYDLIISSSYLVAKGVITGPDQLHVCYCHSPVRYAWDLQHQYLRESGLGFGPKGLLARAILHYLRNWDVRSSLSVDQFIANSHFVARRIKKLYRRNATVIHPPVATEQFVANDAVRDDFYLVAGRMVPYKRTDMIVQAFSKMRDRKLVVIGDGPEMNKVREVAGENVTILGYQDNAAMVDYMRRAKALVFAAEEDFGIVPVEALACGTPVIAYGKGGVTESVADGLQGVYFEQQTPESLIDAIERFEAKLDFGAFAPRELREHSLQFSSDEFRRRIADNFRRWIHDKWPTATGPVSANGELSAQHAAIPHPDAGQALNPEPTSEPELPQQSNDAQIAPAEGSPEVAANKLSLSLHTHSQRPFHVRYPS